jgi:peptidoglycan/xylan/chitin deacetylase (PgdA/CDA1 family)
MSSIALTYDDGPDPVWTPRLLALLKRLGARATFFPIAPRAAAAPQLVARMLADGHSVGLHCDEHLRHSECAAAAVESDTDRALTRLRALGVKPGLWRTPWGVQAPFTEHIADAFRLRLVGWTCDTHDWRGDTAAEMFAATRDELVPDAIVLAHDGIGPGARREDAAETLRFTELAIGHARRSGMTLEALA